MARAYEVVLRVRAKGQQGVEFALSGSDAYTSRSSSTWWFISALSLVSGGLLSSLEWDMVSLSQLSTGLVLAALAAWIYQASGSVVIEEAMLVVPALGVRLSKRRRSGAVSSKFVDLDKICGVAVNEAITSSTVMYVLVLMVDDQSDMVLPFETFRPRVALLQDIYHKTTRLLFPHGTDRTMRLPSDIAPQPC